jgi:dTDP-4-amino-4,6-dideoxygalactose transaminase
MGANSERNIPLSKPSIDEREINEIVDTIKSGWLTIGPKTERFAEKAKKYMGCKRAIPVNSCTSGLHLSLKALGIGPGDEVITTPLTFTTTVANIIHVGAKPVLADIDRETFNINPEKIKEKITNKTKAILPVHYAGQPCDMDPIMEIATENNLLIVEDSAHAFGAEYKGKKAGLLGNAGSTSFYVTKSITTSEGGLVTTNDEQLGDKIGILSNYGVDKKREPGAIYWHYKIVDLGFKYYMTDMQASLGLHQIDKLDGFIDKRKKYSQLYDNEFSSVSEVTTPHIIGSVKSSYHLYPILVDVDSLKISRDEFIVEMKKMGIGASVHFMPIHMHPYYSRTLGYKLGDLPNSEYVFDRIISIPLFPDMGEENVLSVVDVIKGIIEKNKQVFL